MPANLNAVLNPRPSQQHRTVPTPAALSPEAGGRNRRVHDLIDRYIEPMEYERITIDPDKMRGAPCIRGLRIPVATVLGQLAAGRTNGQILADFPDLEADDITAALEYAAAAVQERELPLKRLA
jgi:uncharacterized protein (DUF433 family)